MQGQLPEAEGVFQPGTAYSARDPALLAWVHATLIDMNLQVYELYVGDLSPAQKDGYCAEASAIEPDFGIPQGRLPRSFRELRQYVDSMLVSGEIAVGYTVRALARGIVYPPVPRVARPATWLMRLPTIGLLPPTVREAFLAGHGTRGCCDCQRGWFVMCCREHRPWSAIGRQRELRPLAGKKQSTRDSGHRIERTAEDGDFNVRLGNGHGPVCHPPPLLGGSPGR